MKLTQEQVDNTCKLGQGEKTCAFLTMAGATFQCAKGTFTEATIYVRLAQGTMNAKGNNCNPPWAHI